MLKLTCTNKMLTKAGKLPSAIKNNWETIRNWWDNSVFLEYGNCVWWSDDDMSSVSLISTDAISVTSVTADSTTFGFINLLSWGNGETSTGYFCVHTAILHYYQLLMSVKRNFGIINSYILPVWMAISVIYSRSENVSWTSKRPDIATVLDKLMAIKYNWWCLTYLFVLIM